MTKGSKRLMFILSSCSSLVFHLYLGMIKSFSYFKLHFTKMKLHSIFTEREA